MTIESINEPGTTRTWALTPNSINEPLELEMPDAPEITSVAPDTCAMGDPDFTLYVTGTGFYAASVIFFAGHDEPTTLNQDGTLSTGVKPSLWMDPVTVQCQVRNGEVMSNAMDFTFTAPGAARQDEDAADPDELEGEIEEAAEEGDFKPLHRGRPTTTLSNKRSKARR